MTSQIGAGRSTYYDFDVAIEESGARYRATVTKSPFGEPEVEFASPLTTDEQREFAARRDAAPRSRGASTAINELTPEKAMEVGTRLFAAVFSGQVGTTLALTLNKAQVEGAAGARIRLNLRRAGGLAEAPWEFLYDAAQRRFVAQTKATPLVRYIPLPQRIDPLTVTGPLRILVAIAAPTDPDYAQLDVAREWAYIDDAISKLRDERRATTEVLQHCTWDKLRERVGGDSFHVLHFIGHGVFQKNDGALVFEDETGHADEVAAVDVAKLLADSPELRLAVLNACEAGRGTSADPLAGMAQTLIRIGVEAVVAMQFAISDPAAIEFARRFYAEVAKNRPVDLAVTEARIAMSRGFGSEWATPVLYMRSPDGQLFDVRAGEPPTGTGATPQPPPGGPIGRPTVSRRTLVVSTVAVGAVAVSGYLLSRLVPAPSSAGPVNPAATLSVAWPLRGLVTADPITRRPVVVRVANDLSARPQSGIEQADIGFEMLIEGGLTRYAVVFHSQEADKVGPIRSARWPDLELLPMLKGILAHVGAQDQTLQQIRKAFAAGLFVDVDEQQHPTAYERLPNRPANQNVYTSTGKIRQAAADSAKVEVPPLPFGESSATGRPAATLTIPYAGPAMRVVYEPVELGFRRTQGGQATTDGDSKREITPKNVIVVKTDVTPMPGFLEDTAGSLALDIRTTGTGVVVVLVGGKRYDGTWSRKTDTNFAFVDAAGAPIRLRPGLTWFHIVPLDFNLGS
jgi:hypothetical protein